MQNKYFCRHSKFLHLYYYFFKKKPPTLDLQFPAHYSSQRCIYFPLSFLSFPETSLPPSLICGFPMGERKDKYISFFRSICEWDESANTVERKGGGEASQFFRGKCFFLGNSTARHGVDFKNTSSAKQSKR